MRLAPKKSIFATDVDDDQPLAFSHRLNQPLLGRSLPTALTAAWRVNPGLVYEHECKINIFQLLLFPVEVQSLRDDSALFDKDFSVVVCLFPFEANLEQSAPKCRMTARVAVSSFIASCRFMIVSNWQRTV